MRRSILFGALTVFALMDSGTSAFRIKKRQEEDTDVANSAPVPLDQDDQFKYDTSEEPEPLHTLDTSFKSGNGNSIDSDWSNKTDSSEDGSGPGADDSSYERYFGLITTTATPKHWESEENDDLVVSEEFPLPSSKKESKENNDVEELPVVAETKRDCRRVKFQTENPKIDVVIAIDTNLGECLQGLSEANPDTKVSETKILGRSSKTHEVIVYKDEYYSGTSRKLILVKGQCSDIPYGYNDQISSIDTKGACVTLYQHADCIGRSAQLKPTSIDDSKELRRIGMNNDMTSFELC